MAVFRKQVYCPHCGEPYKEIHKDCGKDFYGDTFLMWDIAGHECSKKSKKIALRKDKASRD